MSEETSPVSSHESSPTDEAIKLFISSVSSNREIKRQQNAMVTILSGQKVDYETIDIATSSESKDKMRELMGDETALPPQIFRGEKHLGNFEAFDNAVEDKQLPEFLHG